MSERSSSRAGSDPRDPPAGDSEDRDAIGMEQTLAATGDALPTEDLDESERPTVRAGEGAAGERGRALVRGDTLGRYVVLELLGAGGMGEVYAAYDPELDRKIALKVLRPKLVEGVEVTEARARLLREAQAMARLSHPNVIGVFDVATVGEDVYVAMEFVDGPDLRGWLRAADRSWREIVELFLAAARGLAAAHEAGLVHRDFKPDNVLIGSDGRVRVIDFGLARRAGLEAAEGGGGRAGVDAITTTETGAVMGTPAYMAPEQFEGRPTDARTDQFNFAVSLYEALFGERPFPGQSFTALAVAVTSGERRPKPTSTEIPSWMMSAVDRALSTAPEDRFGSMDEMVEALSPAPRPRSAGWVLAIGAAVLVGGAGLAAFLFHGSDEEACRGLDAPLAEVWGPERKREVKASLDATELPYTDQVWERVESTLDDYADRWVEARVEACRATSVRKEQSAEMLSRRMACLDRRLRELDAVVSVMTSADEDVVENAAQAAAGLSPVSDCDNESLLLASDPDALGARNPRAAKLDRELARAKALDAAGKYEDGRELAEAALAEAREAGIGSREARALYWTGAFQWRLGEPEEAVETLFAAVRTADGAGDPMTEAMAWPKIVRATSSGLDRYEEAERWAEHARVAIEQAGGDHALAAELHYALGGVFFHQRRYSDALSEYRAAAALYGRAYGEGHWRIAAARGMEGGALRRLNRHEEAASVHRTALASLEESLGPDHPLIAAMLNNLGNSLSHVGELEEAREAYERSLRIKTQAFGPEHPGLAKTTLNLGLLEERLGRFDRAIERISRAVALRKKMLGEDHPAIARTRHYLARIRRKQGKLEEAERIEEEVLLRYESVYGADDVSTANIRAAYCDVLTRVGRVGQAVDQCARAVETLEEGPDRRNLAWALTYAGLADLEAGRSGDAVEKLERARSIREEVPGEDKYHAETDYALARALTAAGRERDRALELAQSARETLRGLDPGDREFLPDVEKFLAQRGR